MLELTAIILTGNEELHIKRCLDRISPIVKEIFIIDCYSKDRTIEIARQYENVSILQNKWVNYATQFNWALENAPIRTKWVLRLDADEYLSEELVGELQEKLPYLDSKYTGIVVPLQRVFMGKNINHGIARGIKMLRIFQFGKARSEVRMMDEHIELIEGEIIEFIHSFSDDNLNDLSWWTQKHIGYAIREAVDLLDIEYNLTGSAGHIDVSKIDTQALNKRRKKHSYAAKPLFWRSFAYFIYRYFIKGGFRDFFQGLWYRSFVDAKVYEIKKACGLQSVRGNSLNEEQLNTLKSYLRAKYCIEI